MKSKISEMYVWRVLVKYMDYKTVAKIDSPHKADFYKTLSSK